MMMFSSYSSTWNVSLFFHPPLEKCIICYSCNCKSSIALYFRWRYVKLDIKSDPMWTKVKSSVKQEISEKYLIFFYLVHTAAFKGFVVKAFSISERRSDFMRIWEKIASRHFCAVKIFSRIFFQIFSTVCLQKFVLLWKCLREKFIQIFSTVCLQKFVLLWK